MKCTKSEILRFYTALVEVGKYPGVKFAYAVAKNANKIKGEIEAIQKTLAMTDDFQKYEKERLDLVNKYGKKDEKGKPIIEGNRYLLEDETSFEKEFKKLTKEHQKTLDARMKQIEEYNELLTEEIEVDLYTIDLQFVPEGVNALTLEAILPMIVDSKDI